MTICLTGKELDFMLDCDQWHMVIIRTRLNTREKINIFGKTI